MGTGFTVNNTLKLVPEHPFAIGVTLYSSSEAVVPKLVSIELLIVVCNVLESVPVIDPNDVIIGLLQV